MTKRQKHIRFWKLALLFAGTAYAMTIHPSIEVKTQLALGFGYGFLLNVMGVIMAILFMGFVKYFSFLCNDDAEYPSVLDQDDYDKLEYIEYLESSQWPWYGVGLLIMNFASFLLSLKLLELVSPIPSYLQPEASDYFALPAIGMLFLCPFLIGYLFSLTEREAKAKEIERVKASMTPSP